MWQAEELFLKRYCPTTYARHSTPVRHRSGKGRALTAAQCSVVLRLGRSQIVLCDVLFGHFRTHQTKHRIVIARGTTLRAPKGPSTGVLRTLVSYYHKKKSSFNYFSEPLL